MQFFPLFFILIITTPNKTAYFVAGMKLTCAVLWIWVFVMRAQGNYLFMLSNVCDYIETLDNDKIHNVIHWTTN